jgi:hypothetical protein
MLNKVLSTHQKIYFLIEENIKMENAFYVLRRVYKKQ